MTNDELNQILEALETAKDRLESISTHELDDTEVMEHFGALGKIGDAIDTVKEKL